MAANRTTTGIIATLIVLATTGCASKTVVVPKHSYAHHNHVERHVIYHVKPAKRHCWRHRGHWHCR